MRMDNGQQRLIEVKQISPFPAPPKPRFPFQKTALDLSGGHAGVPQWGLSYRLEKRKMTATLAES